MKKLLALAVAVFIYGISFAQTANTTIQGGGNDEDGNVVSYSWKQISGSGAIIANPKAATTAVSNLTLGVHVFEITVTDDRGATSQASMKVTVILADNIPPVAFAGTDQVIKLPSKPKQP